MEQHTETQSLTVGRPITKIFFFAVPFILSSFLQQLYNFADTAIVGRCIGLDAVAALGVTYSLNFLALGFVQGACTGFGIPLASAYGAGNRKELNSFLWNGIFVTAVMALIFPILMILTIRPLLGFIHTPENIMEDAVRYITIIYAGIPATLLFNYSTNVLRASGDSLRPFLFLIVSSVINIVLDYLFIVPFGWGVTGAALATVLSQLISGIMNVVWILRKTDLMEADHKPEKPSVKKIGTLLYMGVPIGLENSVCSIGAFAMQNAVNQLGSAIVAAQTAGDKIRQMFTLPMENLGMSMATYTGQNLGAGNKKRIREGIKAGVCLQLIYSILIWFVVQGLKQILVQLVLGAGDAFVVEKAVEYLDRISFLFIILGVMQILRYTIQGLGYSVHAILSGAFEVLGRCLGGWIALSGVGYTAICYANPLAWTLALIYCAVLLYVILRRFAPVGSRGRTATTF